MGGVRLTKFLISAGLLVGFGCTIQVWSASSYLSPVGSTQTITEFTICKNVVNHSLYNVFIPTNTDMEWSTFYTFPPTGVELGLALQAARSRR